MNVHALTKPFRYAASFLAPRFCVVCGAAAGFDARYPLCESCRESVAAERISDDSARCELCSKPLISEQALCMRCRSSCFNFDAADALFPYDGKLKDVLLAYKSEARRSLALFFAELLSKRIAERYEGACIVPVPPRRGKLRKKGWDQMRDITRVLRRDFALSDILRRGGSVEQKSLDREARALNIEGGFFVKKNARIPERVVLIDDVMTTGATLSDCARALKQAGVRRVDALVIAAD